MVEQGTKNGQLSVHALNPYVIICAFSISQDLVVSIVEI
jgi:hypothetical protein